MIVSVHTNGLFNLSAILIGFQYLYCSWAGKNGCESDLCHCCYSCCVGIPILIVLEWVLKHPSFIAHKLWAPHGCRKPANFLQHYFEILSFGWYIYIDKLIDVISVTNELFQKVTSDKSERFFLYDFLYECNAYFFIGDVFWSKKSELSLGMGIVKVLLSLSLKFTTVLLLLSILLIDPVL